MTAWADVYAEIVRAAAGLGTDTVFFRGHASQSWSLIPTLGRERKKNDADLEAIAYFDFVTRAGPLLKEGTSAWNVAFAMQHHGMPTRLLDWTESFAAALYFAIRGAKADGCIWMLDPFRLNQQSFERAVLLHPSDLNGDYKSYFIDEEHKLEGRVVAISPLRHHTRVFSQRAGFTVHQDLDNGLEAIFPKALRKVIVPKSTHAEARNFLRLAGLSEFTLFPDLDGLARELNKEHYGKPI